MQLKLKKKEEAPAAAPRLSQRACGSSSGFCHARGIIGRHHH